MSMDDLHMSKNNAYPCVFGVMKNDSSKAQFNHIGLEPLFRDKKGNLRVWMQGYSPEIHIHKGKNKLMVFLGRLYEPVLINPYVDSNINQLNEFDNADLYGNYLYIYIEISSGGNQKKIRLQSDWFGTRLILYCRKGDDIYFSTHLSGLKKLLAGKLPGIDHNAFLHYYHFGQTGNSQTLFESIKKVPPGTILEFDGKNLLNHKYFNILNLIDHETYKTISWKDAIFMINAFLEKSINKRLEGISGKVGLSISGGLDSGFIAKLLFRLGYDFIGYNLSYWNCYNEHQRLEELTEKIPIKVKRIEVSSEEIQDLLINANTISSEPIGLNDSVRSRMWKEAGKDGVNIMFEGGGADHLFFGMNRYLIYCKTWELFRILSFLKLNQPAIFFLDRFNKPELKKLSLLLRNWGNRIPPYPKRILGNAVQYSEEDERFIYELGIKSFHDEFLKFIKRYDLRLYFSYQTIMMDPEEHFYPSAEVQFVFDMIPISPFWDKDLVRLALSIPMRWKTKRSRTKYILRKAAEWDQTGISAIRGYWQKRKIGLPNPLKLIKNDQREVKWLEHYYSEIIKSDEYFYLKEKYPHDLISPERLLAFYVWKKLHI